MLSRNQNSATQSPREDYTINLLFYNRMKKYGNAKSRLEFNFIKIYDQQPTNDEIKYYSADVRPDVEPTVFRTILGYFITSLEQTWSGSDSNQKYVIHWHAFDSLIWEGLKEYSCQIKFLKWTFPWFKQRNLYLPPKTVNIPEVCESLGVQEPGVNTNTLKKHGWIQPRLLNLERVTWKHYVSILCNQSELSTLIIISCDDS